MNSKLIALIVAGIVVVGGGIYLATKNNSKNSSGGANSSQTNSTSASSSSTKKACDLFTLADAKQVLGSNAQIGTAVGNSETSSPDVNVTTCTYTNGGSAVGDIQTSTVLVRAGLTSSSTASNQAGFNDDKTRYKSTDVSNLGDGAHYNSELGQLDVLKGSYWLIITSGGVGAANHSQAQATQIAQLMLAKL